MGRSGALQHHIFLALLSLVSCSCHRVWGGNLLSLMQEESTYLGGMECGENDPHPGI